MAGVQAGGAEVTAGAADTASPSQTQTVQTHRAASRMFFTVFPSREFPGIAGLGSAALLDMDAAGPKKTQTKTVVQAQGLGVGVSGPGSIWPT